MKQGQSQAVVRQIRRSDWAEWKDLWSGYLTYYETQLPEAVYASTFERLLGDDPRDFSGLVAEVDGIPVGLTHYLFHRHCWKLEDTCYLQDLYTAPSVRGQGVGARLIEAVYAAADAVRAPSVYWLTQDFNAPARRLYDAVGSLTPFIKYQRVL